MKKIFLSLAILLSASLTAFAGPQKDKHAHRGRTVLPTELNLSEEQQKKVDSLNTNFKAQFKVLKADTSITKESKQTKRQELARLHKTQIESVLTAEQKSRLSDLNKQRASKENRKSRGNKDKDVARQSNRGQGNRFSNELGLSTQQQEQMKALKEDFKSKEKSKESRKEHRAALMAILSPEQQAKLKEQKGKTAREFRKHGGKRSAQKANFDAATTSKLEDLRTNFKKEKQAIEMSRIAPEEQNRRLEELRSKYREERREITKDAHQVKKNKQKTA